MASSLLFTPLTLRGLTVRNRAWVSPMCQYSAQDGLPNDWHLVHLGGRAVGGAGRVLTEATAVLPEGRISPRDTGLWSGAQTEAWARIAAFVRAQGAAVGVQLGHAGRKASTRAPWEGGGAVPPEEGGWQAVGPSALAFGQLPAPRALSLEELALVREAFVAATRRAAEAGFQVVELHAAHGYLLHQFLSPLANARSDAYGGSFEARVRFPLEVVRAVRQAWPQALPLFVRLSATDWAEGGWTAEESVDFSRRLKAEGVDLVDVSTGGMVPDAKVPVAPGYQVPFSAQVRQGAQVATSAVGMLTEPWQVEAVLQRREADAVMLAREVLRHPNWPLFAGPSLGDEVAWPPQYERAKPRR
jgi:2,4-dienoyl-CoA reductase-like NADH-dependent reductase (Old Yellow Enzyme family)